MSHAGKTLLAYARLSLTLVFMLPLSGCQQDPATTVTIEITGISAEQDREQVQETLKGMTAGSSHSMFFTWNGEIMTIKLSPVRDVEAFSRKISFGQVSGVHERTVKVTYVD